MNQPRSETPKTVETRTQEILEEANRDIFDGKLTDVLEVTYAYKALPGDAPGNLRRFNATLFCDFAGYGPETPADELLEGTRAQLETSLSTARKLRDGLSGDGGARAALLRGSLDHAADLIECALIGLPYEAEKAGVPCAHGRARRVADVAKLEEIEARAFGGTVRSNPQEAEEATRYLGEKLKKGRKRLSDEEFGFMDAARAKMAAVGGPARKAAAAVGKSAVDSPAKNVLERKIPREKYVRILELALEIYGIDLPVVVDERSSVYDGEDALHVPAHDDYAFRPAEYVLRIVQHEIETHCLTLWNNREVLGSFRGARYLEREEGLARVMERVGDGERLGDLGGPDAYLLEILAGELLEGADFSRFMDLWKRLDGHSGTPWFLRRKRNYPLDVPGAQHKDVSYGRGTRRVARFLREGGNAFDLFVGKVSFDDVGTALALAREKGVEIKRPIFVAEAIRFALAGNKVTHDEFVKYLRAKYPFLGDRLDPAVKLTRQNAAKVKKILRLLGA